MRLQCLASRAGVHSCVDFATGSNQRAVSTRCAGHNRIMNDFIDGSVCASGGEVSRDIDDDGSRSPAQVELLAQSVQCAIDSQSAWEWAAQGRAASLGLERAYDVQAAVRRLREARGEQVAGFKVNFKQSQSNLSALHDVF